MALVVGVGVACKTPHQVGAKLRAAGLATLAYRLVDTLVQ